MSGGKMIGGPIEDQNYLTNRVMNLEYELEAVRRVAMEMADLMQICMANGLNKFLTGHGYIEFGPNLRSQPSEIVFSQSTTTGGGANSTTVLVSGTAGTFGRGLMGNGDFARTAA